LQFTEVQQEAAIHGRSAGGCNSQEFNRMHQFTGVQQEAQYTGVQQEAALHRSLAEGCIIQKFSRGAASHESSAGGGNTREFSRRLQYTGG